jgi:triacylglycerol lipase
MRQTSVRPTRRGTNFRTRDYEEANLPILTELLFAAELILLHAAPVYYGLGAPKGDDSGVVLIPGFLCPDHYLLPLHRWLGRIGYLSFRSGISLNAECPNILIRHCLNDAIDKALDKTGRKIHLIGHSLGGIMARSIAGQRAKDIASVITLGAPFRGTVAHSGILRAADAVRHRILKKHGPGVLPACYTARCTCDFVDSLQRDVPSSVLETAIYTHDDGLVDWRYCKTDNPETDFQVTGTHIGLAFNPSVYGIIADRLAQAHPARNLPKAKTKPNSPRSCIKPATSLA